APEADVPVARSQARSSSSAAAAAASPSPKDSGPKEAGVPTEIATSRTVKLERGPSRARMTVEAVDHGEAPDEESPPRSPRRVPRRTLWSGSGGAKFVTSRTLSGPLRGARGTLWFVPAYERDPHDGQEALRGRQQPGAHHRASHPGPARHHKGHPARDQD